MSAGNKEGNESDAWGNNAHYVFLYAPFIHTETDGGQCVGGIRFGFTEDSNETITWMLYSSIN